MQFGIPTHLVKILRKLRKDQASEASRKIFGIFIESEFFTNLAPHVKTFYLNPYQNSLSDLLDLVVVLQMFLDMFPSHLAKFPLSDILMVGTFLKQLKNYEDYVPLEDVQEALEHLKVSY